MNPYAAFLDGREPHAIISRTARELETVCGEIGAGAAEMAPAAGKWSARDIVSHLADCEVVFAFRLRQTLAEPHHVIQPFDQERWAARYPTCSLDEALGTFRQLRRWNLTLIEHLTADERLKPVTHPERGTMTCEVIVETMAGHDVNHLRQLRRIADLVASKEGHPVTGRKLPDDQVTKFASCAPAGWRSS
jgi:uncharacterized damage-inducible protein DinB